MEQTSVLRQSHWAQAGFEPHTARAPWRRSCCEKAPSWTPWTTQIPRGVAEQADQPAWIKVIWVVRPAQRTPPHPVSRRTPWRHYPHQGVRQWALVLSHSRIRWRRRSATEMWASRHQWRLWTDTVFDLLVLHGQGATPHPFPDSRVLQCLSHGEMTGFQQLLTYSLCEPYSISGPTAASPDWFVAQHIWYLFKVCCKSVV